MMTVIRIHHPSSAVILGAKQIGGLALSKSVDLIAARFFVLVDRLGGYWLLPRVQL